MKIIKTKVIGDTITPIEQGYVIENQVNQYAIEFDFDETWNFEEKYCIFQDEFEEQTFKRAIINNQVIVPSELLNGRITIQVYGQNIEDNVITNRQPSLKYVFSILNSLPTNASEEQDVPTPTQWELYIEQIEEMCNDLQDQFDDLKEECETKCDDVIERLEEAEQDIQTNTDNIRANAEAIDKLNTDLLDYSLITETGNKLSVSIDSNYLMTITLKDKNNNILSTASVDFPIESAIVNASYNNSTKEITFTLQNGNTLVVPIGDIISGLASQSDLEALANRVQTIENDYLTSTDKTELQESITNNINNIKELNKLNGIKNLFSIDDLELGTIVNGVPQPSTIRARSKNYIPIENFGTYRVIIKNLNQNWYISGLNAYDENYNQIASYSPSVSGWDATISVRTKYIKFIVRNVNNNVNITDFNVFNSIVVFYDGLLDTRINNISVGNFTSLQKNNLYNKITQNDVVFNHTTVYDGSEGWDDNTITSPYLYMTKGSIITFNNGVSSRITRYNDDRTYISNTGSYSVRNTYTIPEDNFYKIGLAGNQSLESIDAETLVDFVGYTEKTGINSASLMTWQYGSIDNNGKITSSQNRIISSLLQVGKGTIIKILDIYNRYNYCIDKYDYEGNYIDSVQWNSTTNIINENCQIRIRLAYSSGRNITNDDLQLIPRVLYIEKYISEINVLNNKNYECSAHRGSLDVGIPENTILAFKCAKEHNFDSFETDVRMTSDHIPIICHDDTINRVARNSDGSQLSSTIYVASSTFDELNQYDYGIYAGSQYAGTHLLTFEEAVKFAKYYNININIDCKITAQSDLDIIYNVVRKYGMQYNVRWTCQNSSVVNYLLSKNGKLQISWAMTPTSSRIQDTATIMVNYPLAKIFIDCAVDDLTTSLAEEIQANDIRLSLYCSNNNKTLQAINYGAVALTINNYLPYELFRRTYDNL